MATVKKIQGFAGSVKVGATSLCVTKFEVEASVKADETPDTCSAGYTTRQPGLKDAKGSFSATYDGTNAPTLDEGDEIVDLVLAHRIGSGTTPAFSIASAWVTSKKLNNPIPGLVSYDISWEANGQYQWGPLPA